MSDTPIYDALLFSKPEYVSNASINPLRIMTWQGKRLGYVEMIPGNAHREDNFS